MVTSWRARVYVTTRILRFTQSTNLMRFHQFYSWSLCAIWSRVDSCDTTMAKSPAQGPAALHFHSQTLCSPPQTWWPRTCSFCNLITLGMLQKWNHTVCNLLRWTFLTQHNALETHHAAAGLGSSFLLTEWCSVARMSHPLTTQTLKGIRVFLVLGFYEHLCTDFYGNIFFPFSSINAQEYHCWTTCWML